MFENEEVSQLISEDEGSQLMSEDEEQLTFENEEQQLNLGMLSHYIIINCSLAKYHYKVNKYNNKYFINIIRSASKRNCKVKAAAQLR